MSLKKQLINYFQLNKDAGSNFLFFDDKIKQKKIEEVSKKKPAENYQTEIVSNFFDAENEITKQQSSIKLNTEDTTQIMKKLYSSESNSLIIDNELYNFNGIMDLISLNKHIAKCHNCVLGATRTNLVFGEGNPNADIMIVGEAPGADEDEQGLPFVGKAGKLLTDILKAVDLSRSDVYIANICKCRPPGNRKPLVDEIFQCEKFLHKQIEIIKPQFILALGLTAAEALFKQVYKMGDIRGKLFNYRDIKTLITYHPAALLRNPNWKRPVWEDMKLLRSLYDDYLNHKK